MNAAPGTRSVTIRRSVAITLLHLAQTAPSTPVLGVLLGEDAPERFIPLDLRVGWMGLLERLGQGEVPARAVFLHRPMIPPIPDVSDFDFAPALPRLTTSLATKGVLQLRAWGLGPSGVRELELVMKDD